jgi:predicted CoA-binding protein
MSGSHQPVDQRTVDDFLKGHRFALIGASDDAKSFSRAVMTALEDHGYEVVPVNPRMPVIDGRPSRASVGAVEGTIDGAIIMVPAVAAEQAVRDCIAVGITKIWLFKGVGTGACSDAAAQACRDAGIGLVNGACPLMFLDPVRGVHRFHRGVRRARRTLIG